MADVFRTLLSMSLTAAAVALIALPLRWLFRQVRLPAALCVALWLVVLVRMVLPAGVLTSRLSLVRWSAFPPEQEERLVQDPRPAGAQPGAHLTTAAPEVPSQPARSPAAPADTPVSQTGQPVPAQGPAPTDALFCVWLAGVAGVWGYAALSWLRLRFLLATAVRRDGYWESDRIPAPFVFGLFRPRIYLPAGVGPDALDWVLRHERAHLRLGHHWLKPLFFLALGLHWFNPVLWLAWVFFCRDLELCCDEAVLRRGGSGAAYSAALLSLAAPKRGLLLPPGFGETDVKRRIRAALRWRRPARWAVGLTVLLAVLLLFCLGCDPARRNPSLPEAAPALTVSSSSTDEPHSIPGTADALAGRSAAERIAVISTSPSLTFCFETPPDQVQAVEYQMDGSGPVSPLERTLSGPNGADGQYFLSLERRPDSAGDGSLEERLIVLTCRWGKGEEAKSWQYAVSAAVPSLLPGTLLDKPVILAGENGDWVDSEGSSVWLDYGSMLYILQPQGRAGREELRYDLVDGAGNVVFAAGHTTTLLDGDPHSASSYGFPLYPLGLAEGDPLRPAQRQRYTLTYRWADGGEDVYTFEIDCPAELALADIASRVPAPASWADQDLGDRNQITNLEGLLTEETALWGFSDNSFTDGWLVFTIGHGVGGADTYVYRTHDGGETWTETGRPEEAQWHAVAAAFPSNDVALIAIGRFNGAPVFRTGDGGATWEHVDLPLLDAGEGWEVVSIQTGGPMLLTCARQSGESCTLYSTDEGVTWRTIPSLEDPEQLALSDLPWPPYETQGTFFPDISNWYDNPIKLVGFSDDRTAAVFSFDEALTGCPGLLLCVGGQLAYFPALTGPDGPRMSAANPVWGDFDADGAKELAVTPLVGTGTGVSMQNLYLFEWDGAELTLGGVLDAYTLPDTVSAALPEGCRAGSIVDFWAEGDKLFCSIGVTEASDTPMLNYVGTLEGPVVYDGRSISLHNLQFSPDS
ncbi:M56 family metallopeptidase [Lawsonibacter celer]|uniref:M56 family metallopeptidase n=1 Tax=Lawsonibacter celer TaxID=2986526 RepID=UPI001648D84A|nr:M56 family metallopeptidase [Lawsonibacter celer]